MRKIKMKEKEIETIKKNDEERRRTKQKEEE